MKPAAIRKLFAENRMTVLVAEVANYNNQVLF
jgi:hypothetical protein